MPVIRPAAFRSTVLGATYGMNSQRSSRASSTSSSTARISADERRNATITRAAPQRREDVAQSMAVSPAPSTMTRPKSAGSEDLHAHRPGFEPLDTAGRNDLLV